MQLWNCFEQLEDPRRASGRRYTLVSVMKLLLSGLLCGRKSLAQIVLWGRSLPPKTLESLGFNRTIPCVATLSNLLRRLPIQQVERALSTYTLQGKSLLEPGSHIALDGKTLRASHHEGVPLVHLLSALITQTQAVLGQLRMEEGENEISAALRLLEQLNLQGSIVTGDAIFAQKKFVN